jgi:hypothetical protein
LAHFTASLQPDDTGLRSTNATAFGPGNEQQIWINREPDWLRNALGAARSTTNTSTTMNFTLGIEGDFPSGNQHWDASITTGRSDNVVDQLGSARLSSYRDILTSPNFGAGATFDPNPWEAAGFAESTATCTSGLPVVDNRQVTRGLRPDRRSVVENVRR